MERWKNGGMEEWGNEGIQELKNGLGSSNPLFQYSIIPILMKS
jgi:hypothetical protein